MLHIRWMLRHDMPEVMGIETANFEYAWTDDDFLRCLRQRNCIGMVAERSDSVISAFMIYELHRTRLHLLNFAVHPQYQRTGVGSQMVDKLVYKLFSHRRQRITLAVRESNTGAQLFFRSHRFKAIGVLPSYYIDSGEAAYEMVYEPAEPEWDTFGGAQFEEG